MNDVVVVDTDILIDAGRAVKDAIACLEQIEQRASLAISAITRMELMVGCRNKTELRALDKFLERFQAIKLNELVSDVAVDLLSRYRLSHGLLIPDSLIAATALALSAPFITKNQSDYRFIADLQLLAYPQPFPA